MDGPAALGSSAWDAGTGTRCDNRHGSSLTLLEMRARKLLVHDNAGWRDKVQSRLGPDLTLTSTSMPRWSDGNPRKVPWRGSASRGSRTTATVMRSFLPTAPFVGSKSIQPPPGRYTCAQA